MVTGQQCHVYWNTFFHPSRTHTHKTTNKKTPNDHSEQRRKQISLTCFSCFRCLSISSSMMSCRLTGLLPGLKWWGACWLRTLKWLPLTGACCRQEYGENFAVCGVAKAIPSRVRSTSSSSCSHWANASSETRLKNQNKQLVFSDYCEWCPLWHVSFHSATGFNLFKLVFSNKNTTTTHTVRHMHTE